MMAAWTAAIASGEAAIEARRKIQPSTSPICAATLQ
jgi:hypothetical protein